MADPAAPSPRAALVTGASDGIGAALARRLVQRGTTVIGVARRREKLEALAAELHDAPGTFVIEVLDVSDGAACAARMLELDDVHGGIDLVVANAGFGESRRAQRLDWEHCARTLGPNVIGATATLAPFAARMAGRGRGQLVGISSLAQYRGWPKTSTYSGSKAYLSTFLESLRVDLRGTGVAVSDIRPGFIHTAMTAQRRAPMPFAMDLDTATDRILAAIDGRRPLYAFPRRLAWFAGAARMLPRAIYERFARRRRGS